MLKKKSEKIYLVSSKNPTKRKRYIIFLTTILILLLIPMILSKSTILNVKKVNLYVDGVIQDSSVFTDLANKVVKNKLYDLDIINITEYFGNEYPNLKLVEVKSKFPDKVEIFATKRYPKYNINYNGEYYDIDSDYIIIGKSQIRNSKLFIEYKPKLGSELSLKEIFALEISTNGLNTFVDQNSLYIISDNGLKIYLPEEINQVEVTDIVNLINKLIRKYDNDAGRIEFIDLRFSKPVIKYI